MGDDRTSPKGGMQYGIVPMGVKGSFASSSDRLELLIENITGKRIKIYGADNPDALRGGYLDDATLDEYADMYPGIFGSIIRPMLADRQGTATFIGTPKGRNAFFDLFERAKTDQDWFPFFLPASETGILPQSELTAAAREMTPEQYEQEFECSFEAAIIGAYYGKDMAESERAGRITDVAYDPALPVYTTWDLGIGDSTAIWFWQAVGAEIRVIDFYEASGESIEHYAKVLHAKPYKYEADWVPHDARVRELGTGRTRIETMLTLKLKPKLVPNLLTSSFPAFTRSTSTRVFPVRFTLSINAAIVSRRFESSSRCFNSDW